MPRIVLTSAQPANEQTRVNPAVVGIFKNCYGDANTLVYTIFIFISHIIQLKSHQQSAESRNSAGAEALAVARRPEEATTHTTTAERRVDKQCRGRGASSGQTTRRGNNSHHNRRAQSRETVPAPRR